MKPVTCLALVLALPAWACARADSPATGSWVEPMKKVHARFTGQAGAVAQIGDSITITMAFFVPLRGEIKNLPDDLKPAHEWIRQYVQNRCWSAWKGAEWGNTGMMTSRWGAGGIERWLKKMNPEVALIMFGTNDTNAGPKPPQYTENMRKMVRACVSNGTVPILYTIPPVGSQTGNPARTKHVESFVQAVREVAAEEKVPMIDFYKEIMTRQPANFAKTLLGDNLHPSYPGEYQRDFSEDGLKNSGYTLRNYLTLKMMWEVHQKVLLKVNSARAASMETTWKGPTFKGRPAVLCARCDKPPVVDGRLDDPAWKKAARLPFRFLDGDTKKPTYPTEARLVSTAEVLFVAFACTEPKIDALVSRKRPRDSNIWEDDSVEVFLKPGPQADRQYYHLIVNPEGSFLDEFGGNKGAWQGALKIAAARGQGSWTVEVAIPFAEMKLPGNRARLAGPWRLNLTRFRPARAGALTEDTALSPTGTTSSHVPAMFAFSWFEAFGGKLPAGAKK